MLDIQVNRDEVHFGASVTVHFMRTVRVPEDSDEHPVLPTFGEFEVHAVQAYADRVPAAWRVRPGVFIPMHQKEAMVISLSGRWWKPNAVKVGVGRINGLTGAPWHEKLIEKPQNYLVCPQQHLLGGFRDADGRFRQFAAPRKPKDRVAATGLAEDDACQGLQIMVFEPRPGLFSDHPPPRRAKWAEGSPQTGACRGKTVAFQHEILPDPHNIRTWDSLNFGRVCVHIVDGAMFREITGRELAPSPIRASEYAWARPAPSARRHGDTRHGEETPTGKHENARHGDRM